MKKTLSTMFLASLLATAAFAQRPIVQADIPFDFKVGTMALPRGLYTVQPNSGSGTLLVRRADGTASAFVMTNGLERRLTAEGKLVFNRYGTEYFLSQVWIPGRDTRVIPPSRAEREIARSVSGHQTVSTRLASAGDTK